MNQANNRVVYLVVICITFVSMAAGACGAWLVAKGYQGGEILLTTMGTGLGGLIALLSSTGPRQSPPPPAEPTPVQIAQPPANPVPVQEVHPQP